MKQASLDCAGRVLDLSRTNVMGVLNVTPDSFYEGSRYQQLDDVLRAAESMVEAGVDIFDVGGESTRPGADGQVVTPDIELERVVPVVEALNSRFDKVISVDTSSAQVMAESVKVGAGMINDVRALYRDGALEAAVQADVPVVLMHSLVDQPEPGFVPSYEDIVMEVGDALLKRADECMSAGLAKENIVLDPGFGAGMFGKTPAHNLSLLKGLEGIVERGFPVLAGLSRKSFMRDLLGKPFDELLPGSLSVAVMAAGAGASIIRVHDVAATKDAVFLVDAVRQAA